MGSLLVTFLLRENSGQLQRIADKRTHNTTQTHHLTFTVSQSSVVKSRQSQLMVKHKLCLWSYNVKYCK